MSIISRDQLKEGDRFDFANNQTLIIITSKFFIYERLKLRIKNEIDILSNFFMNFKAALVSKPAEI